MAPQDTTETATEPSMPDTSTRIDDFFIRDTLDSERIESIYMSHEVFLQAQAK